MHPPPSPSEYAFFSVPQVYPHTLTQLFNTPDLIGSLKTPKLMLENDENMTQREMREKWDNQETTTVWSSGSTDQIMNLISLYVDTLAIITAQRTSAT